MSTEHRTFELGRIARAVRAYTPRPAERDPPFHEAAVALVLRAGPRSGIELLFIHRAEHEDDPWSGQIALPGGRRDATDATLEDTAVRETLEETGLDLRSVAELVGALDELRPRTPVLPPVIVRPFVALLSGGVDIRMSGEVADHFWADLDAVFDPAATRETTVVARGFERRVPAIHHEGRVIWGMTERILRSFERVMLSSDA
jgi:8-oxo-dGTP pyrophosphatase MutT (NUDIX family)